MYRPEARHSTTGTTNKILAKEIGSKTFVGSACKRCGQKERYTERSCCARGYTETGVAREFNKRKHQLLSRLKAQATFKSIEFDITEDDIEWCVKCPILEIDLDYFSIGRRGDTASFDRKDPTKGYTKGNVFIISNRANMIKSDMTNAHLERMVKYVGGQNSK